LALPNGRIACLSERSPRKLALLAFQILKANHIGLAVLQPFEEVGQPRVDVVNVEGRDLHAGSQGLVLFFARSPLFDAIHLASLPPAEQAQRPYTDLESSENARGAVDKGLTLISLFEVA
jgi:hypothetical protein